MIYLNVSYLRANAGPETLVSVPAPLALDVEECIGSLLRISEFISLKFFVYISSEELKTTNLYLQIPSGRRKGRRNACS
jgi:hypothetical protein